MLQELVKEMNKCKAFSPALILKLISITFHVVNNDISYIFFCWCDNNSALAATKLRTNIKSLHSDITPFQLNKWMYQQYLTKGSSVQKAPLWITKSSHFHGIGNRITMLRNEKIFIISRVYTAARYFFFCQCFVSSLDCSAVKGKFDKHFGK